jgi:H+/Cl- antiporter ClcA
VVLESVLIGVLAGLIITAFRWALSLSDAARTRLYQEILPSSPWYWTLAWVLALTLVGLFLGWSIKRYPMIKGSGIPQVKGVLERVMRFDWLRELPLKLITGLLGLGAGLSLGREGPSIQIGAYVGRGVLSAMHRPGRERNYLIAAAGAAGLSAAFNAPLAGVLFIQEELLSSFSPLLLACAMGASMAADAVARAFMGTEPVFLFREISVLGVSELGWIILLGVICGLLGHLFKCCIYGAQDFYTKLKIPVIIRPVLPLLLSVPLGFTLIEVLGGGHPLIEALSETDMSLWRMVLLLVVNMLFTCFCYGSGTSGGIFFPLLACGALIGTGFGQVLEVNGLIQAGMGLNFLILSMAAYFTAIVGAPLTGIVLILEMTANFNHLGNLVLVCLSAYMTINLLASRPVYMVLLERLLGKTVTRIKKEHPLG